jgi:hypothetical protein
MDPPADPDPTRPVGEGDYLLDTHDLVGVKLQSFLPGSKAYGKPFGVVADRRFAPITNVIIDRCVFDHTNEAAFHFLCSGSADRSQAKIFTREFMVTNTRLAADKGRCILVEIPAGAGIVRGMMFRNIVGQVEENRPVFELAAEDQFVGVDLDGIEAGDSNPGVPKDVAVALAGSGWTADGVRVRSAVNNTRTSFKTAVQVRGPNSNDFALGQILPQHPAKRLLLPAFNPAIPNRRQIAA